MKITKGLTHITKKTEELSCHLDANINNEIMRKISICIEFLLLYR